MFIKTTITATDNRIFLKYLKGKVVLHGNVDPLTLFEGSTQSVEAETRRILEILGSSGGIVLGDGFNVVPASPLENLEAVRKTSQAYGVPKKLAGHPA